MLCYNVDKFNNWQCLPATEQAARQDNNSIIEHKERHAGLKYNQTLVVAIGHDDSTINIVFPLLNITQWLARALSCYE